MKLAYIAGPFRGPTAWDIAQNVRRAEEVGLEVAKLGFMPVIPHANTHLFHGQLTNEFWIKGTKALLEMCDVIVLLPGWSKSIGVLGELRVAVECSIPIVEQRSLHFKHEMGMLLKLESQVFTSSAQLMKHIRKLLAKG